MQKTSTLYKTAVGRQIAPQGYIRITFGLTDTDAAATCAVDATPGAYFSQTASMLAEDGAPTAEVRRIYRMD